MEPIIQGGPLSIIMAVVILMSGLFWVNVAAHRMESENFAGYLVGYVLFTPVCGAILVKVLLVIVTSVDQACVAAVHLAATIAGFGLNLVSSPIGFLLRGVFKEREHQIAHKITEKLTNGPH
jgi:hypothetical protein